MKDHEIREFVNELRDLAIKYHAHQSLRDRVAHAVLPALARAAAAPARVFAVVFNPCIYESAAGVESLHRSRETAEAAMHAASVAHEQANGPLADWEGYDIAEYEVLP